MKKRIRVCSLVLAVLLSCTVIFTSCAKLSVKDVEADPTGQIFTSAGYTADAAADSCVPISVFRAGTGKMTIALELDNEEFGKMNANIFADASDKANPKSAVTLSATSESEEEEPQTFNFELYGEKDKLAIRSPELFNGAYGIDLSTAEEDLKDSGVLSLLGMTYDDVKEYIDAYTKVMDSLAAADAEEKAETLKKSIKEKLDSTDITVAKEKVDVGGETGVDAITVNYSFKEDVLNEIVGIIVNWGIEIMDEYPACESILNEIGWSRTDLEEWAAEIETYETDADINLKFALNKKTTDIMRVDLTCVTGEDKYTGYLDMGAEPASSEKWDAKFNVESEGEKTELLSVSVDRVDNEEKFLRSVKVIGGDEYELFNFSFDCDKATGAYKFVLGIDGTDSPITVSGIMSYSTVGVEFTIDAVEIYDDTVEIGLKVTIVASAAVPAVPEFTNLLTMDAESFEGLMNEIFEKTMGLSMDNTYDDIYTDFDSTYDYDGDGDTGDTDDYNMWLSIISLMDMVE